MQRSDWSGIAHGDLEFMGPYDETSFEHLLDGAALPIGARVLDLGCGNGALLRWLASRTPIDGTGVDRHPGTRPIPGVRLVAGDARSFPAEPGSFDLVCSAASATWPHSRGQAAWCCWATATGGNRPATTTCARWGRRSTTCWTGRRRWRSVSRTA
jgi:SAM-dependent methyltransferase